MFCSVYCTVHCRLQTSHPAGRSDHFSDRTGGFCDKGESVSTQLSHHPLSSLVAKNAALDGPFRSLRILTTSRGCSSRHRFGCPTAQHTLHKSLRVTPRRPHGDRDVNHDGSRGQTHDKAGLLCPATLSLSSDHVRSAAIRRRPLLQHRSSPHTTIAPTYQWRFRCFFILFLLPFVQQITTVQCIPLFSSSAFARCLFTRHRHHHLPCQLRGRGRGSTCRRRPQLRQRLELHS